MYEWIEIAKKLIWLIKPIQWYTAVVSQNRADLGVIVHSIMIFESGGTGGHCIPFWSGLLVWKC